MLYLNKFKYTNLSETILERIELSTVTQVANIPITHEPRFKRVVRFSSIFGY